MFKKLIDKIPTGYSEGLFKGRKYGISKVFFNKGLSCKIFAEELGGNDFISLNFYQKSDKEWLKPCEMPEEKVVSFLEGVELLI